MDNCVTCGLPYEVHAEAFGLSPREPNNCAERHGETASQCQTCRGRCPGPHAFRKAPIASFQGPYRFLSNFWVCDVVIHGAVFPSSEHAYQAMKCARPADWPVFQDRRMTPAGSKKRINGEPRIERRPDWFDLRLPHMRAIVYDKFTRHADLRLALLSTGTRELIEGNTWGDTFWGVCAGKGENWLGRTLMDVRAALRGD